MKAHELVKVTWNEEARRIVLEFADCVLPYVRQTRNSRYREDKVGERVRRYNDQQARLRDALVWKLKQLGVKTLPVFQGKPKLGFSAVFRTPKANVADLGNYEKASEDLCNRVIYSDDVQVFERGKGSKNKARDPWMRLEIWEVS